MKRFIMEQEGQPLVPLQRPARGAKVAIIGAGPAGLSAAGALAEAGFSVTIFEAYAYPGGMVGGAIPEYRLPQASIDQDMAVLRGLGVEIRYGQTAGLDFTLKDLRTAGYEAVFVAVGAQLAKRLGLPGEDADGVIDALHFLRSVREGTPLPVGPRVGVIGAGDTAMDTVRSALRVGAAEASLIYRRTVDQMPADPGGDSSPAARRAWASWSWPSRVASTSRTARLAGLVCPRTEYRGDRDAAGRKIPHDVPDSEFEIPLDTLILAISQHSVLDFFGDEMPELTRGATSTSTRSPSRPRSPASMPVATWRSDGRPRSSRRPPTARPWRGHRARPRRRPPGRPRRHPSRWTVAAMVAAACPSRVPRAGRRTRPLDGRGELRADRRWATPPSRRWRRPAAASTATDLQPVRGRLPEPGPHDLRVGAVHRCLAGAARGRRQVVAGERQAYRAEQSLQIAVLTDFCNECGNCETFCPTAGEPYRDKPRLYLDRAEFEAQSDNAFMLFDGRLGRGAVRRGDPPGRRW